MKKTIVYYYSRKGNNRFLSEKIAVELNCDIEEIRPRLNAFPLILMGASAGIWKLKDPPGNYDRVILCGPVFVGKLITPLKHFLTKYGKCISRLVFVTCCGSGFEQKNEKYGHGHVFNRVRDILGDKCVHCEAFPISLVIPEEIKKNPDSVIKTRLNEENFRGEFKSRFEQLITALDS